MRLPWQKPNTQQLDLLGSRELESDAASQLAQSKAKRAAPQSTGRPCIVPISKVDEDPANPRAQFPDAELDELASDIRLRGILVPLVVHPVDPRGRYLLHFGARRLRAALRAGLHEVPVVVRDAPADRYAQAAENLKRTALPPLDLARLIRQQVDAGDSHAEVARRLGMNLTTVAHHLSLLDLPPVLADALQSGRCTSPRTLHELRKLSEQQPEKVRALVDGEAAITRSAVAAMNAERSESTRSAKPTAHADAIARANAACGRLERALGQVQRPGEAGIAPPDLTALRMRVEGLAKHWLQGSDRQTP